MFKSFLDLNIIQSVIEDISDSQKFCTTPLKTLCKFFKT